MDMVQFCRYVGALIKPKKLIGSTTSFHYLGILLDTINQEAKLPGDKLSVPLSKPAKLSELAEFKTMAMATHLFKEKSTIINW